MEVIKLYFIILLKERKCDVMKIVNNNFLFSSIDARWCSKLRILCSASLKLQRHAMEVVLT